MGKASFQSVRFIKSAADKKALLYDHPTVTFVGRSNVGKSTLINTLVRRNGFMKTSKTAGRTSMVNYALVDEKFYVADVPGYGFATFKRDTFAGLMKDFLEDNHSLKRVYILVDARRLLMEADSDFADYLESIHVPFSFVFTKCDKLNSSEKHFLKLQEEKLQGEEFFEVGLKKDEQYQLLRDSIIKTIKGS